MFWEDTGASVLPAGKPPWAANGYRNWAPEIHRVGDHFVVYYTTVNGADVLSIGAAYAKSALGPYTDVGGPLVEHPYGVIDPHLFKDDDRTLYLIYKIDENAFGKPTPNDIRRLAPDGLSFGDGAAEVELLSNNAGSWEGGVVEGAWMVKRDGWYYIFYSGNTWQNNWPSISDGTPSTTPEPWPGLAN